MKYEDSFLLETLTTKEDFHDNGSKSTPVISDCFTNDIQISLFQFLQNVRSSSERPLKRTNKVSEYFWVMNVRYELLELVFITPNPAWADWILCIARYKLGDHDMSHLQFTPLFGYVTVPT